MENDSLAVPTARGRAAEEDGFIVGHFQGSLCVSLPVRPDSGVEVYVTPLTGPNRGQDTDVGELVCKGEAFKIALFADCEAREALARMLVDIGTRMLKPKDVDNLDND